MHEIGIVRSMCKTVVDYAHENNISHIDEIVCSIGELSLVIPEYVEELYPPVSADIPELQGTRYRTRAIAPTAEASIKQCSPAGISQ